MIIKTNEVLIVALDFSTVEEAKNMVNTLGSFANFYKVGLQLFSAKDSYKFIEWLKSKGKKVFLDLKMFDIPETVFQAAKQHTDMGVDYTTVHGCSVESVSAAVAGADGGVGVLAVTLLTSHNDGIEQCLVGHHAKNAKEVGAAGAIMSGWEAADVRRLCPDNFIVVCPGIRDTDMDRHDQKRTIGVESALENGAHHLVVGRPITKSAVPEKVAENMQRRILTVVNAGYDPV